MFSYKIKSKSLFLEFKTLKLKQKTSTLRSNANGIQNEQEVKIQSTEIQTNIKSSSCPKIKYGVIICKKIEINSKQGNQKETHRNLIEKNQKEREGGRNGDSSSSLRQMPRFVVTILKRMDFDRTRHHNLFITEKNISRNIENEKQNSFE